MLYLLCVFQNLGAKLEKAQLTVGARSWTRTRKGGGESVVTSQPLGLLMMAESGSLG